MDAFSGVLLFGSYITDFILGDDNTYGGKKEEIKKNVFW